MNPGRASTRSRPTVSEIPGLGDPHSNFALDVATKMGYFEQAISDHSRRLSGVEMEIGAVKEKVQSFRDESTKQWSKIDACFDSLKIEIAKAQNPSISVKTIAKIAIPILTGSGLIAWLLEHFVH